MTNEKREKDATQSGASAKEILLKKIIRKFPSINAENEDEFFEALLHDENCQCEKHRKVMEGQEKLAALFNNNPKMGTFIAEVVNGEDAIIACVRNFGSDMLTFADDEDRMSEIREANAEYLQRMSAYKKTRLQQEENWKESQWAISKFKARKEMTEEDFETFMNNIYHMSEHIFMAEFTPDILEMLYKGVNYDTDIHVAEKAANIRGRNERILLEKKQSESDMLHGSKSFPTSSSEREDRTPLFGFKRRPDVWK